MHAKQKIKLISGITLIELLLVVAILGILLVSSYPLGSNFLTRNTLEGKVGEITNSLGVARINSMSGKEDSRWGVYISGSEITLFKGDNYAGRDTVFDETYSVPGSVSVSGSPIEIVFDKLTGDPDTVADFIISNNIGDSVNIVVNEVGVVDVN